MSYCWGCDGACCTGIGSLPTPEHIALLTPYHADRLESLRKWAREEQRHNGEIRMDLEHWITESPECGTTMCLGGYTVYAAGAEFVWAKDPRTGQPRVFECTLYGESYPVMKLARKRLGLGEYEAFVLFNMDLEHETEMVLDFLDELCLRARRGADNMPEDDVKQWIEDWYGERIDQVA